MWNAEYENVFCSLYQIFQICIKREPYLFISISLFLQLLNSQIKRTKKHFHILIPHVTIAYRNFFDVFQNLL